MQLSKRTTSGELSTRKIDAIGILDSRNLPDDDFLTLWDAIIVEPHIKDQLLAQAVLNFTLRARVNRATIPLHGVILLVGPPGTGKTSLARGLAARTADTLKSPSFFYVEVEPHALASSALGKSQKAVTQLLGNTIAEQATIGPLIVLLDEVETLAAERTKLSLEANPIDVHRTTDAILAQLDHLAANHPNLLFIATSNFPEAIDAAFLSRVDSIVTLGMPDPAACRSILASAIEELAKSFPKLRTITSKSEFEHAAKLCHGLDGRRIRKLVVSACTFDKQTALDPNQLSVHDLVRAAQQAHEEARGGERKKV